MYLPQSFLFMFLFMRLYLIPGVNFIIYKANFAPIVAVKFQRYVKSIMVNVKNSSRLELFSLFLNGDYDNLDFNFYMKTMAFFDETNQKGIGLF